MSFVFKKQYFLFGMFVFVALLLLNNNSPSPAQCQYTSHISQLPTKEIREMTESTSVRMYGDLPMIYGITPTYTRLAQKADLTRLSQTLMLVKNFHWIVIEDSDKKTPLVANLLKDSQLSYTHLNAKTIVDKHLTARGVEQRNKALSWLRDHLAKLEDKSGLVYFMDDDNTYSLKVFDEMRKIKKVGAWPVGIVGGMRVEMPIVTNGKITAFNAGWKPSRPFPIDMAGFAINTTLIMEHPEAKFSRKVESGYQESEILKYVLKDKFDMEPLADNCTKVYVWHTRTQKPFVTDMKKLKKPHYPDSHIEV